MNIRTPKQAEVFLRKMEILRSIMWAADIYGIEKISWRDFSPVKEYEDFKVYKTWHKTLSLMAKEGLVEEFNNGTKSGSAPSLYRVTPAGRKFYATNKPLARRVWRTVK